MTTTPESPMRNHVALLLLALGVRVVAAQQPASPPAWAYGFAAPLHPTARRAQGRGGGGGGGGGRGAAQQAAPDTTKHTIQGSSVAFTLAQVRDGCGPGDWVACGPHTMHVLRAHV